MYTLQDEINNVGKGWHPLCQTADAYIKKIHPDYKVTQIKEKFGGLRFYYELPAGAETTNLGIGIRQVVSAIETLSFVICEECGEPGELRSLNHWYLTRCDKHFEEAEAKRRNRWKTGEPA